jgi:SNF2 family DNA or RNA helicase
LLHGTWSPTDFRFFLWGEDAFRARRQRARTAQKSIPRHPFQAPLAELSLVAPDARELNRVLLLPSAPGAGPVPGPELDENAALPAGVALAPWIVSGLSLAPAEALAWLASLPDDAGTPVHARGEDLRVWSRAARLALELLLRERFIPTCDPAGPYGRWRLTFAEPGDQRRLEMLIHSLPAVSRALVPHRTAVPPDFQPPAAESLLTDFLQTAADALIRTWLGGPSAGERAATYVVHTHAEEWVAALAAPTPTMLVFGDTAPFVRAIGDWAEPALTGGPGPEPPAPFRTCLRLEPPPDDEDGPDAPWRLSVMLQAADDPSLLVPAEAVWRERGTTLRYLNRRFDHPQERLLADLGIAARAFGPLEPLLQESRPSACTLSLAAVYALLTGAALRLEECGLGVLLPAQLQAETQVSARARVRSGRKATDAGLGLAQVLEVDWDLALGDQTVTRAELKRLARLKLPLVRLRGRWVQLDQDRLGALLTALDRRGNQITAADALRVTNGVEELAPGVPADAVTIEGPARDLLGRLTGQQRIAELSPPVGLQGQLRPYQARGFAWLAFMREHGIGACLADDMGLGKTIQVIALLLHEQETGQTAGPVLLVCPTSLVGNWQRELERFGPSLRLLVHHGSERLRGEDFGRSAAGHDVVISTYALSHRDRDDLADVAWAGIVLDEAQAIKNAETRQSQSLRTLTAGYRIALTGTPVENRLSELWSLLDFLNPGYLGSAAGFHRRFAVPIERRHDEAAAARLRRLVEPFVLRRVKTDPAVISDLPAKLEQPVYVNLTPEQASLYQAVTEDVLAKIAATEGIQRRGLVLSALTRLKQLCNHPAQFLGDRSALPGRSGKLNRLTEMLEEALAEGDRALIFTQYAEMGRMLQGYLAKLFGREVLFLHGAVTGDERSRMVARFQEEADGPPLFILTLKAGGVGLNLTRASHVFHFDRWWNPAVENQATDRAFRIGQRRNVMVHKLIAAGTVEEKIDALISGKRHLAEQVVGTGETWLTELSTDQLRTLFTLERE